MKYKLVKIKVKNMNYDETFFYGIDFKKIKLFCKVNTASAVKTKILYKDTSNMDISIQPDHYYEVEKISFVDELLTIKVVNKKRIYDYKKIHYEFDEEIVPIILNFDMVEFSYYFIETKEENLNIGVF